MKRLGALALLPLLSLAAVACSQAPSDSADGIAVVQSKEQRITTPNVPPADAAELRDGNSAFAVDLYKTLAADPQSQGKNLFFSPHSISIALAMTYAGARGQTATEMATALHYTLPQDRLHPAFDALDLALNSRAELHDEDASNAFKLHVVDSIFGAPDLHFLNPFLDTLAESYGAGVRLTDFKADPEGARGKINDWVANETESKIKDLLGPGTIDQGTRTVLVNAVYFNATWSTEFAPAQPGTFHGVSGDTSASLMSQVGSLGYAAGDGWQAASIPYKRGLSMVAVVPTDFGTYESTFTPEQAKNIGSAIYDNRGKYEVTLTLPKFKIEGASFSLKDALTSMGMKTAFVDGGGDFSGMSDEALHVSDVIHKAFVAVDEKGTEAAAATAVVMVGTSSVMNPPDLQKVKVTADKPFLFFIRDDQTGAILFLGRVLSV